VAALAAIFEIGMKPAEWRVLPFEVIDESEKTKLFVNISPSEFGEEEKISVPGVM
jgi:hypothetical protein